jgi:NAD(P)-dependent dehydrogenase (short-subunit alcohol dehydrogenase family)
MQGALITGGGKRLGAAMARHLGAQSWHVFIHHHRSGAGADELKAEIEAKGGQATLLQADLADEAAVLGLIEQAEAVCPLGLLINNASDFVFDKADTANFAALDRNMRVNLFAPALLTQHFYHALVKRGKQGVAVSIVDNKVFGINPDYFSYTLSKVALQGMIQMQAMSLAPTLRVAGIAPGITLISGLQTEAEFARSHANNPMGKGCTPEQICHALDFILASPAYHGQTMVIDGGQVLQRRPRDVVFLEKASRNGDL